MGQKFKPWAAYVLQAALFETPALIVWFDLL